MASLARPVIKFASPGRWAVRADLDDALLGVSLMFAGAAVWGSAVAVRDQLPGEPLGITVPLIFGLCRGGGAWPELAGVVRAGTGAGPGAAAARREARRGRPTPG